MLKRAKNFVLLLIVMAVILGTSTACKARRTLLFLNWGEYINDDLVVAFEEQYDCDLIVDIADSNELFYAKLKSGTTAYDLCCPAEYMVEKMYLNGLIQEIDFTKLENYNPDGFMDGIIQIEESMNETMRDVCAEMGREYDFEGNEINRYHMPYFWGTFGLMYNKNREYFKDEKTYDVNGNFIADEPDGDPDVLQRNNAWEVYFFDENVPEADRLPMDFRVGMYNSVRFNYGAVMTYNAGSPNVKVADYKDDYREILSRRKYAEWGGDTLKHGIESHNLDIAFAYTGDCLDMTYIKISDGYTAQEVEFDTFTPGLTMAHIDTLVIPSHSRNTDLAYAFLDFLLEPINAWYNNRDIGYCPPLKAVYDMIVTKGGPTDPECYAYFDPEDEEEKHWRENWAYMIEKTFPIDSEGHTIKTGIPFSYFDNSEIKVLNNIVNNIKANTSK